MPNCGGRVRMHDWRWYALAVEPGHELRVQSELKAREVPCFTPLRHTLRKARKGSRRRDLIARSLVPGYVIVGLEPHALPVWTEILDIPHVVGVLGANGLPQPVREPGLIAILAGSQRPMAYVNLPRRQRRRTGLKRQRTAVIVNGPYADKVVRIIEKADADPEIFELLERHA